MTNHDAFLRIWHRHNHRLTGQSRTSKPDLERLILSAPQQFPDGDVLVADQRRADREAAALGVNLRARGLILKGERAYPGITADLESGAAIGVIASRHGCVDRTVYKYRRALRMSS